MPTTPEARKSNSIALLRTRGVYTIDHLPVIEPAETCARRSAEEIRSRALAHAVYFLRGQFVFSNETLQDFQQVLHAGLAASADEFTDDEHAFVESASPSEHDVQQSSWSIESVVPLLWSIGLLDDLPWPEGICNLKIVLAAVKASRTAVGLKLRPLDEILDQADIHYRLLWACRNHRISGTPEPEGIEASVVIERHRWPWLADPAGRVVGHCQYVELG